MPKHFYKLGNKDPDNEEVDYTDLPTVQSAPVETASHAPIGDDFWQSSEQESSSVTIDYAAARRKPSRPPDYNLEEHYETPTFPREIEAPYQGPAHFAPLPPSDDGGPATAPIDFDGQLQVSSWDSETPIPEQSTPAPPAPAAERGPARQPAPVSNPPQPAPAPREPVPVAREAQPAPASIPAPEAQQSWPPPPPTHVSQRIAALKRERAVQPPAAQPPNTVLAQSPGEAFEEANPYENAAVQRSTIGIIVGLGLVLMMFAALLLLVVLAFAGEDIARFLGLIG